MIWNKHREGKVGMGIKNPDLFFFAVLSFLFLVSITIIGIRGEFPLNDDWAYARSVWVWVNEGDFFMEDWPAMTLIMQVLWGGLFCEIFGLSFETLRCSTLVSAYVACGAMYFLAKRFATPLVAMLAGLSIWLNPLVFSLSFTFMTDVHFLAAFLMACLFFTRYLEANRAYDYGLAILFSLVATGIRQPGIFVPLGFGAVLLIRARRPSGIILALLPFALTLAALQGYLVWLYARQPELYRVGGLSNLLRSLPERGLNNISLIGLANLFYVALFAFPLILLVVPSRGWSRKRLKNLALLYAGLLIGVFAFHSRVLPIGNIIYNLGLGPKLLKDSVWGMNVHPATSRTFWKVLDALGLLGTLGMFALLVPFLRSLAGPFRSKSVMPVSFTEKARRFREFLSRPSANTAARTALLIIAFLYLLFTVILLSYFDRYSIPLFATFSLLLLPKGYYPPKKPVLVALTLYGVFFLFDITSTHDYLSWNRVRQSVYSRLTQELGIKPGHIDAGFEINSWMKAGPYNTWDLYGKSWWMVDEEYYVLSFGPYPGFSVWEGHPYPTLLPPGKDSLFVLKKRNVSRFDSDTYPVHCDFEDRTEDEVHFISENREVFFSGGMLQSKVRSRSKEHAIRLSPQDRFGMTHTYLDVSPGESIRISVWRYGPESDAGLVLASETGEEFYLYEPNNVVEKDPTGWSKLQIDAILPASPDGRFDTYVWNREDHAVWFDDLEIQRIRPDATGRVR